jgi:SAM-dependent methyltransferase
VSFYLGRYAELYDLFYANKPYSEEARFIYDRLCFHGNVPPQRILELACGTGAHAIELAKFGCTITATDCSSGMLKVAQRKVTGEGAVTFSKCDMQYLSVPDVPYDAVICLFDSIGFVETDENLSKVLNGARKSLKAGGLFLFEFWHAVAMRKNYDPIRVKRIATEGRNIIRISETNLDLGRSVARVKYDIYEMKPDLTYEHFSETQSNRYFTVSELEAKAEIHGFRPLAAYSGFSTTSAITDESWHVVAIWKAVGGP